MKYSPLLFVLFAAVCGLMSHASAGTLSTFNLYIKDKTTKSDEDVSRVPQFIEDGVTFPVQLRGKTHICDFQIHTDEKTKEKSIGVEISDPSVVFPGGGYLTVFHAKFPLTDKKTLALETNAYSISFKVTETSGDAGPSPSPTP